MVLIRRWILLLIVIIALGSMAIQLWQLWTFIAAGPRFTAQNGQALCERVTALEQDSIGFRQSGRASPPCHYFSAPKD